MPVSSITKEVQSSEITPLDHEKDTVELPQKKKSIKAVIQSQKGDSTERFLGSLMSQIKEEEAEYENTTAVPWTLEHVMKVWNTYIETIDYPSTQASLRSAIVSLSEDPLTLNILVNTVRTQDAINREDNLLKELRTQFRKPQLRYQIKIEEIQEDKIVKPKAKPITDRAKYRYFMEKNPLLKEFQKRFGLYPEGFDPKKKKR